MVRCARSRNSRAFKRTEIVGQAHRLAFVEAAGRSGCPTKILFQFDRLFRFLDEFFKARIASQWIPKRQQFQLAVGETARDADSGGELLQGKIFVANPRSNHCEILDYCGTVERIFFWGKQRGCAASFAQRFVFPFQSGIDQTKCAQRHRVIWLGLDNFLLVRPCSGEIRPRFVLVFRHSRDNAFHKWMIKKDVVSS